MRIRPRIERVGISQENPFYAVLGEPLFLNKNEQEAYLRLRTAIETALAPKNLFDFQNVADIAFRLVERQRLRQAQIAMIKSPVVLADLLSFAFGDNTVKARQAALNYFGDDPNKAAKAAEMIEEAGLSQLQVEGHALVAQSTKLQTIDQLIQFREASNNRTIKDLKKRNKKGVTAEQDKSTRQDLGPSFQNNSGRVSSTSGRRPRIISSNDD